MAWTGARCAEVLIRDNNLQVACAATCGEYQWCSRESGGRQLGTRLLEVVLEERRNVVSPDIASDARLEFPMPRDAELRQAVSIPLMVRGRTYGAINLCGPMSADFSTEQVAPIGVLANLLALTAENIFVAERSTGEEDQQRQYLLLEMGATDDERRRIARELHDGVGQSLTGLLMIIDGVLGMLDQPERQGLSRHRLQQARDVAASSLKDIRRVIVALRPTVLDDIGLFAAVQGYAERALAEAGIELHLRRRNSDGGRPSPLVENLVYRIMQEAVNNVVRHSGARSCRISLTINNGHLRALVEDDGVGFDPERAFGEEHFGLSGMQERVRVIGGSLRVRSRDAGGTQIELRVPVA